MTKQLGSSTRTITVEIEVTTTRDRDERGIYTEREVAVRLNGNMVNTPAADFDELALAFYDKVRGVNP